MIPFLKNSRRTRRSVPLWFYAFIPYKLAESLLIVLLPLFIVQVVGGSVADVAKINSLNALVGMLAFILWGNLSDRLGYRRPFLILGFLAFTVCISLIGLAHSVSQVLYLSTLGAFFIATITPVSSALVLDSFPEAEWSEFFGRFYQISGWSFVAGVLFGTSWLTLVPGLWDTAAAMRSLLLLAGIVSSLSLVLCLLWVKEPKVVRKHRQFHPKLMGRLTVAVIERRAMFYSSRVIYFILHPTSAIDLIRQMSGGLSLYYLCSLLLFFAINLIFVPFPIFLTNTLGATNAQVFSLVLAKSAAESWFYAPVGQLVRQNAGLRLQFQAIAVRCGIFGIFAALALIPPQKSSLIAIGLAQVINGVTWAVISVSSSTTVAVMAPKNKEGLAIGFYNAILGGAGVLGSLASGYLAGNLGYSACFATGALLTGLTAICLWWLQPVMAKTTVLKTRSSTSA